MWNVYLKKGNWQLSAFWRKIASKRARFLRHLNDNRYEADRGEPAMRRLPEVKLMQRQSGLSVTLQNSETTKLSNLLHGSGRSRRDREKSRRRTWVSEERKSTSEIKPPTGSDVRWIPRGHLSEASCSISAVEFNA